MPCNTSRVTSIDIGRLDIPTLTIAITSLGYAVSGDGSVLRFNGATYDRRTGKLTTTQYSSVKQNQLMQAYARQVVLQQAKKAGWQAVKVAQQLQQGR